MTSKLARKVGLKLFEKNLQNYEPRDPVYETYLDSKGRERRRRRALPPGLSPRDASTLTTLQKRAHRLDTGFNVCGMRFGYTFLLGLIPLVGDVADILLSYLLVIRRSRRSLELPGWLVRRMMWNLLVSGAVGTVPLVGDVGVAVWKVNSRNVALVEEFLRVRGEEFLRQQAEEEARRAAAAGGAGSAVTTTGANTTKSNGGWFKRMTSGKQNGQGQGVQGMPGAVAPKEDPKVVKPGAGIKKGENVTI